MAALLRILSKSKMAPARTWYLDWFGMAALLRILSKTKWRPPARGNGFVWNGGIPAHLKGAQA